MPNSLEHSSDRCTHFHLHSQSVQFMSHVPWPTIPLTTWWEINDCEYNAPSWLYKMCCALGQSTYVCWFWAPRFALLLRAEHWDAIWEVQWWIVLVHVCFVHVRLPQGFQLAKTVQSATCLLLTSTYVVHNCKSEMTCIVHAVHTHTALKIGDPTQEERRTATGQRCKLWSSTNHKQVVAWSLLNAIDPVLLMRSGILRKAF